MSITTTHTFNPSNQKPAHNPHPSPLKHHIPSTMNSMHAYYVAECIRYCDYSFEASRYEMQSSAVSIT